MAGRRALVIGSQCAALNRLTFVPDVTRELARRLAQFGDWEFASDEPSSEQASDESAHADPGEIEPSSQQPAEGSAAADPGDPAKWVLLDPDIDTLHARLGQAFAAADKAASSLLVAFVGHGVGAGDQDFYLQAVNSPASGQTSRNAVHLGQTIREHLKNAPRLNGLVVLIDSCETKELVNAAGARWTDVLNEVGGRVELLVAAGAGNAYNGCFTRTLIDIIDTGIARSGDNLLAADVLPPLLEGCPLQRARNLRFDGGSANAAGEGLEDTGLYLTRNGARPRHAVTGRPAAGLLDQVTRNVALSPAQRAAVAQLMDHAGSRLRAFTGPAGCGKTTITAFLVRPTAEDTPDVAATLIRGAVFLDASSTPETVAGELAEQLQNTLAGFGDALRHTRAGDTANTLDAVDVLRLALIAAHRVNPVRVHLVIDGLDQVDPAQAGNIYAALARLTDNDDTELAHLRIITGARSDLDVPGIPGLQHAITVPIPAPTWADARAVLNAERMPTDASDNEPVPGGWIAIRLAGAARIPSPDWDLGTLARHYLTEALNNTRDPGGMSAVVALLTAAGVGPTLPFPVLRQSLIEIDRPRTDAQLRTLLVTLGPLVQRGNPSNDTEHDGMSHIEIVGALQAWSAP